MLPERCEPITRLDPWPGAPFSKLDGGAGRDGRWLRRGHGGGRGPSPGRGPPTTEPLPPAPRPTPVPSSPPLSATGPARRRNHLLPAQKRPAGGLRALPFICAPATPRHRPELNRLWGGGTVAPSRETTLGCPFPRTGAPSPFPGAAHPLGWLMQ